MKSIKKALEKAEEKTQKAVGGSGPSEKSAAAKVVVSESLDELTRAQLEEHRAIVVGAQVLHSRLQHHALKVKELAVSSSAFSGDCHKLLSVENDATLQLKTGCLAFVKLNALGEQLEELAREVTSLEELDLVPASMLSERVAKRSKTVDHMRKKNDANTLTEEKGLHEDVEHLKQSLAVCKAKYNDLLRKISAKWVGLSFAATSLLASDLEACHSAELAAPPQIHRPG